eukprot:CAMPEP_0115164904 /NCGR_PEP_ID=MMETSP0227-20121206/73289_1 /TAXON_ID=89957 /ORGANISM="Polarella glacialis, Strain CCMP 1383" /LENGTH=61 /DNA_ID=CAMNT_0002577303 /DNA_START=120 /DNA_END=305 /DNA_ORIENTATION=-
MAITIRIGAFCWVGARPTSLGLRGRELAASAGTAGCDASLSVIGVVLEGAPIPLPARTDPT